MTVTVIYTKVNPSDLASFQKDITVKYPTYKPPEVPLPVAGIPLDSVVAASAPLPLRPLYPFTASRNGRSASISSNEPQRHPNNIAPQPLPPTPVPSPPPFARPTSRSTRSTSCKWPTAET